MGGIGKMIMLYVKWAQFTNNDWLQTGWVGSKRPKYWLRNIRTVPYMIQFKVSNATQHNILSFLKTFNLTNMYCEIKSHLAHIWAKWSKIVLQNLVWIFRISKRYIHSLVETFHKSTGSLSVDYSLSVLRTHCICRNCK